MTRTIRHAAGAGAPDLALDILDSAGWDASFGDNTPVELIAALLRDLVSGEPLDIDREFHPSPVPTP